MKSNITKIGLIGQLLLLLPISAAEIDEPVSMHLHAILLEVPGLSAGVDNDSAEQVVFFKQGDDWTPLELSPYNLSFALYHDEKRNVTFYDKIDVDTDTDNEFIEVGSVSIPSDVDDVILLFVPQKNMTNTYRVILLNNSLNDSPADSIRLINMTQRNIVFDIAGARGEVSPGGDAVRKPVVENRYARIRLAMATADSDKDWMALSSRYQQLVSGRRTTYLLIPNGANPDKGFSIKVLSLSAP